MAEANIVQDGIDRFRDAFESLEDELERVQKQIRSRRRRLEKRLNGSRRDLEKRLEAGRKDIEKRTRRVRAELRKSPAFKRLESLRKSPAFKRLETLRKDAAKQYEEGVETFLGALQIASKSDVQRIDRKISQLNRKLKEMEKARASKTSGSEAASA